MLLPYQKLLQVYRGSAIDLIEVDPQRQRVLTVGGDMLKLWAFKGHRLLKEIRSALLPPTHDMLKLWSFKPH